MRTKRASVFAVASVIFLLSVSPAYAGDFAPSYVQIADAPTITVDWSNGPTQAVTLHGNRSLIFRNGEKGHRYLLIIRQDATGSRALTWPQDVHWPGIQAPILTTTADKKDYISFFYDGVNYDALGFTQNL